MQSQVTRAGIAMNALPRRVLFVTSAPGRTTQGLRRADDMARMLAAELHVLLTGPRAAARAIHRWCEDTLEPTGLAVERLHWTTFGPPRAVRTLPRDLTPDLIVLPAGHEIDGRLAVRLANETRTPVLVAERDRGGAAIVAAIDPSQAWLPVVRETAGLAHRSAAPALFVCCTRAANDAARRIAATAHHSSRALVALARLRCVAAGYGVDCETVVSSRTNAAEAIVRIAQARRADLVVTGVSPPTWFRLPTLRDRLAVELVEHARRSVLLVPLANDAARAFSAHAVAAGPMQ